MCVCVSICKCLCCCCCCVYFLFLVAAAAAAAVVSSIFVSRAYFAYTLTHTHYIIQLWLGLISSPSPFVLFCFFPSFNYTHLPESNSNGCVWVRIALIKCVCVYNVYVLLPCLAVFFSLFFSVCSFSLFYYSVDVCLCVSKKSMYPHINSYYTHFMTSFYVFSAVVVAFFLSARCLFHLLCFDLC